MSSYGKYVVADTLYCDNDFNDFSTRNYDIKMRTTLYESVPQLVADSTTVLDISDRRVGFILLQYPASGTKTAVQLNSSLTPRDGWELKWCFIDGNDTTKASGAGWSKTHFTVTKTGHGGSSLNAWKFDMESAAFAGEYGGIYFHMVRKQLK
ncbi:MAG: hypothetical protein ACXADH_15675 [Candidatus Kariarchaeaceae archaeon]|jgi:hypothetical protein